MSEPYCPVHDHPGDDPPDFQPWSNCPIVVEGDPPGGEACPHLAAELQRRHNEVFIEGNYYQFLPENADGERWVQKYRNHKPVGEPRPLGHS